MNRDRVFTGSSAANTAKTHTITKLSGKAIRLHSLTVSTRGADSATDCQVTISDNGTVVWRVSLRLAKVFGGHFNFDSCPIPIRNGNLTIDTGAAGALCIVDVSATYEVV